MSGYAGYIRLRQFTLKGRDVELDNFMEIKPNIPKCVGFIIMFIHAAITFGIMQVVEPPSTVYMQLQAC